ncbi:MAG: SpoIIE family protein phosphatase [Treponema sp.]|nr:SpoIIE family protein phosphatase [Treponema sp.]
MINIDTFINVPLLASAIVGLLIVVFLIVIKLRNTGSISFIYYLSSAVIIAGAILSSLNGQYFYFTASVAIGGLLIIPYLIIKAFDNPKKREEKRQAKLAQAQENSIATNALAQAAIADIKAKSAKTLEVNKELISKVSSYFTNENSIESFLEYCNKMITEKVNADGCVILLADEDGSLAVKSLMGSFPPPYKLPEDLPHKPIRVETNLRFATFPLKGNIFGDIYQEGEPVLITDSIKDPRVYQNGPEDFLTCGAYIFVPIKQMENTIGLIGLSVLPGKTPFTKEEFENAIIVTDAIASAIKPLYSFLAYAEKSELSKDGIIATKYQKDMLPAKLPVIDKLQIGCFSNPVENVCGDFYDVLVSRKDRISFVMADVAGKGMNSLVVMIMIRAILRLSVNTAQAASTILSWANRGICLESSKIDHFASVALINYNSTTKEAQIATCGNNPVFLYSVANNQLSQITTPSEPMGVEKDATYSDINITLNSGDILVTCTDGLLESLDDNGVQYSTENLKKVILKNCNANAKDISNRVKEDLKRYSENVQQYDDQSLLVIKIQ